MPHKGDKVAGPTLGGLAAPVGVDGARALQGLSSAGGTTSCLRAPPAGPHRLQQALSLEPLSWGWDPSMKIRGTQHSDHPAGSVSWV